MEVELPPTRPGVGPFMSCAIGHRSPNPARSRIVWYSADFTCAIFERSPVSTVTDKHRGAGTDPVLAAARYCAHVSKVISHVSAAPRNAGSRQRTLSCHEVVSAAMRALEAASACAMSNLPDTCRKLSSLLIQDSDCALYGVNLSVLEIRLAALPETVWHGGTPRRPCQGPGLRESQTSHGPCGTRPWVAASLDVEPGAHQRVPPNPPRIQ